MLHCVPIAALLVLGLAVPAERPDPRMPRPPRWRLGAPQLAANTGASVRLAPGAVRGDVVLLRGADSSISRAAPPLATAFGRGEGWAEFSASVDLGDLNTTLQSLASAVNPPVELYGAALSACAQAAEWRGAEQLLERMRDAYLDVDGAHYTHVIRACARAGEWERAEATLQRARENGLPLTHFAYAHVIDACEGANRSDVAMRVYGFGVQDGAIVHWKEEVMMTDNKVITRNATAARRREELAGERGVG
jgi:pentatricopeptide repeat protein